MLHGIVVFIVLLNDSLLTVIAYNSIIVPLRPKISVEH